jgi:hypothetical protein
MPDSFDAGLPSRRACSRSMKSEKRGVYFAAGSSAGCRSDVSTPAVLMSAVMAARAAASPASSTWVSTSAAN